MNLKKKKKKKQVQINNDVTYEKKHDRNNISKILYIKFNCNIISEFSLRTREVRSEEQYYRLLCNNEKKKKLTIL